MWLLCCHSAVNVEHSCTRWCSCAHASTVCIEWQAWSCSCACKQAAQSIQKRGRGSWTTNPVAGLCSQLSSAWQSGRARQNLTCLLALLHLACIYCTKGHGSSFKLRLFGAPSEMIECHFLQHFNLSLVTNLHVPVWLLTTHLHVLPAPHGQAHIQGLIDYFFLNVDDHVRQVLQPHPSTHACKSHKH